jgi:hypothetical protein
MTVRRKRDFISVTVHEVVQFERNVSLANGVSFTRETKYRLICDDFHHSNSEDADGCDSQHHLMLSVPSWNTSAVVKSSKIFLSVSTIQVKVLKSAPDRQQPTHNPGTAYPEMLHQERQIVLIQAFTTAESSYLSWQTTRFSISQVGIVSLIIFDSNSVHNGQSS